MSQYEVAEVLSETPHRTYEHPEYGAQHFFKIKLTDGAIAEAAKKKPDTPPQVGDRYKVFRAPPENAPAHALPAVAGPITDFQGGGGGGKSYEADPKGLRGKNASSALHAAISLAELHKDSSPPATSEQIWQVADKFYAFIESKAQVGE